MAQYKAWQLMREGLSDVGEWRDGQATGGSTTTIIDTVRPNGEDAALFQNGTAIITYDAGGAAAAPEGEWSRISSFANSTKTFTLASTLTGAVASGDHYVVSTNLFQHNELIRLMNEALRHRRLGSQIPLSDTSITTVANQTEYTLPVGIKENGPSRVWYQSHLDDADDNRWIPVLDWDVTWTSPGDTALLILPQMTAGHTIKIEYLGVHPQITAFSSTIAEAITPDLAVALYVERLAHSASAKTKHSAQPFQVTWDMAKDQLDEAFLRHPMFKPTKPAKIFLLNG